MSTPVTMPDLGESVTEGTVTQWLKQEGDTVEVDEPLLEVSTDKVDTEIPSPISGVLTKILVGEDETVEVGAQIAIITPAGEAPEAQPAPETAAEPAAQPEPEPEPAPQPAAEARTEPAAPVADAGAATPVTMPNLGESVSEGTVTQWLKQEGDTVEADEPLLEVSTDKVDTEIPSPISGVLTKILVGEDETVEVGAQIALISPAGQAAAPAAPAAPQPAPEPKPEARPEPAPQPAAQPEAAARTEPAPQPRRTRDDETPTVDLETISGTGQVLGTDATSEGYVTPLVRKLAAQEGVDLSQVKGTGVGGRIRKQDVLEAARRMREQRQRAAAAPAPAAADTALRGRTETMSRLRQTFAEQIVESLHTAAQLTQVVEVDVTAIARLREQVGERFAAETGVELGFFPFFALAVVEALQRHPKLNAVIDGTEVTYHDTENLAVVVDTEQGVLAPVVKDAGRLSLRELARRIDDLGARARTARLVPDELSGGTFTMVDSGAYGALVETPIIHQPQVAVLSTGTVVKRPVVVEEPQLGEVITVRSMVYLSLSFDHRLIDGADAARFLSDVKRRLEEGAFEDAVGLK
ncbi:2-oxoglutarate dehydrogenase, E2 component, dihydrolipoamide succinyltransferase [Thermobifida fusca]|nr:2-oxoglutarate dehydrogenase, E2 component, dihydrolipoamide succinyltransferase [Thermobifida fusca]QOS57655.1 2-oxoglutarate dehydrogenase, E2 component, dihydrolipoamide succinyltransferase [Thermobifida fusca]